MLNSGQKNPPKMPSLFRFNLKHPGKQEVFYKIRKDDHVSFIKKYCIILEDRRQS
jgi:hypothetical protein